jgi:hypothetical protein
VKPSVLYKIASALFLLFATGHTLGFWQIDPSWKVDSLATAMQSMQFQARGFARTYGIFMLVRTVCEPATAVATVTAWQLGAISGGDTLAQLGVLRWGLALCLVVVTVLNWKYFFWAPVIFSSVIVLCLIAGAWFSPKVV